MGIWTVILKAPNGGIHIEEVEASRLSVESEHLGDPEYVLKDDGGRYVARFPKEHVLGIYEGQRKQLILSIQTAEE